MSLCIIGKESDTNIRIINEAKEFFDTVYFTPIDGINIGLEKDLSILYKSNNLLKFQAILPRIPKTNYSYAYQLLSFFPPQTFMAIPPITFLLASERFFLLTILKKRDVNVIGMKMARSKDAAHRLIEKTKFPIIVRVPTEKTGVVVGKPLEAKSVIDALSSLKQPVLLEDIVKDMVSVYVADPEVITVVKKVSKEKDVVFGKGELKKQKTKAEIESLALDAVRALDTKIARVDISTEKEPKVVNVDLNPDLIKPSNVTGVNIPKKMMEIIYNSYTEHKKKPALFKFFDDAKSVVRDVFNDKQLL